MSIDGTDQRRRVPESGPARARDAARRRSRAIIAGIAAGAVALSGLFSVVAAQAFKGHQQDGTTAPRAGGAAATATRSDTTVFRRLQSRCAEPRRDRSAAVSHGGRPSPA
jgi:hypothetical protein